MWGNIKTVLLLGTLTGMFLAIGYYFGGQYGLVAAFGLALAINTGSYWFSDKIVLALYRAKKVDVLKYENLHSMIKDISKKADIPKPKLYVTPMVQPNAFATGRSHKHAVVCVTQGLLEQLNDSEIEGVLAHEISHIKNNDMLVSTVAATIAGAITFIAFIARWAAITRGMGNAGNENGLELIALALLAPIIAILVRMGISRTREYLADRTGAHLLQNGEGLASALLKLETIAQSNPIRFGSKTTSHMFIVNPFTRNAIFNLFSTHPAVDKRVARLRNMKF